MPGAGQRRLLPGAAAHAEDGAKLDHHLEDVAGRALEFQQIGQNNEMPGRRDRKEPGHALHTAKQGCCQYLMGCPCATQRSSSIFSFSSATPSDSSLSIVPWNSPDFRNKNTPAEWFKV